MCHYCKSGNASRCTKCNKDICGDHRVTCTVCRRDFCFAHHRPHLKETRDCAKWTATLNFFGNQGQIDLELAPVDLELANSIYHHITWKAQAPIIALRRTATTKQTLVMDEKADEQWNDRYLRRVRKMISKGSRRGIIAYIKSGFNPFLFCGGKDHYEWSSVLLDCLKTVQVMPNGNKVDWEISFLGQFNHWCIIAELPVIDALVDFRLTGHVIGSTVYGNVAFLPAPMVENKPLWNLYEIHTWTYTDDYAMEALTAAKDIWLRICELLIAWRSGTIGCHQVYKRLYYINEQCETIIKCISGIGLDYLTKRKMKELEVLNDLVRRTLQTKMWMTLVRQILDRALRMTILGLTPSGCGNRWDIGDRSKGTVEHPENPYSTQGHAETGQEAIEAHAAIILKSSGILKNAFSPIHRYIKKEGDLKDADYWDAGGFPWDQKTAMEVGSPEELVVSIVEKIEGVGQLWTKGNQRPGQCGIVVDATYCSLQFYERVWEIIYDKFDLKVCPFLRKSDNFPLFLDVVSTNVVAMWCAREEQGIGGMLLNFNGRLDGGSISFKGLCEFADRLCTVGIGDNAGERFKKYIGSYAGQDDDEEEGSWTWHRDRKEAMPRKGVYFEYPLKYKADYKKVAKGRILINWTDRVIFFSPIHYNPFVVDNQGTIELRDSMFLVTAIPDAFWTILQPPQQNQDQ